MSRVFRSVPGAKAGNGSGGGPGDQSGDQRPSGYALDVGNHRAQCDAGGVKHLVPTVLFACQGVGELLAVARHETHLSPVLGRHEARLDQAEPPPLGTPCGIGPIGCASGDVLAVPGVDHVGGHAGRFQSGVDALPVDTRAFHDPEVAPAFHRAGQDQVRRPGEHHQTLDDLLPLAPGLSHDTMAVRLHAQGRAGCQS